MSAIELNQGDTKSGRIARSDVARVCVESIYRFVPVLLRINYMPRATLVYCSLLKVLWRLFTPPKQA